ncbi:DUF1592 domain-containing protein [Haloferula helveola]
MLFRSQAARTRLVAGFCVRLALVVGLIGSSDAKEIPTGVEGHQSGVKPFFEEYCIRCHGPDKSKGKITLHTLDGDLAEGQELERWEDILDVLDFEEMPPEDEKQPSDAERQAVVDWIDGGLRDYVDHASKASAAPQARRLTNFEYQNTMRDLFGFELDLVKALPEDPKKPYHFNNTAEFMLLGPEQVDRYLDNARRMLSSAIVDPEKPEVIRHEWNFEPARYTLAGSHDDEVGVFDGGRRSVSRGVNMREWPSTGEYRIRIKAGAILPPGYDEVPLRIVMGSHLRHDAGTGDYHPVGTVHVSNDVDHLKEFEFRGRIENHPYQVGKVLKSGKEPDSMWIYPQNLFDNGQLNDHHSTGWEFDVPRAVVRKIEFEGPIVDVWPPEHHTRILPEDSLRHADPDAYVRGVLQRFMTRAFRRPVASEELDRFASLYKMLEPGFDSLEATMRETLAMVLISPQFLYHTVAGDEITTPEYELASKLSYFLWGSLPDEELLALAAEGDLDDPEVIVNQVGRMLADERAGDFIDNFATQWLSIEKMKAVNINLNLFPRFLYTVHRGERSGQEVLFRPTIRDYMHEETVGFIRELVRRNASVLDIVDSDFAWLNEPLAAHYGIEGVKGLGFRAVAIKPDDNLGGLPTQGSVLVGNGTGSAPHPIYRAVWLREAILGDEVKPPPAEVPALSDTAGESADHAVTIKDLLALHRTEETCNDCHVRLDPWGIPFERYNAAGQFQAFIPQDGARVPRFNEGQHGDLKGYNDALAKIFKIEVDASARVPHGPEVDGMRELKDYLLGDRDKDIAENVLRRLLGYGLGRALTYRDRYAVEELLKTSEKDDYAFQDMIVAVCKSDTFRNPTPNQP